MVSPRDATCSSLQPKCAASTSALRVVHAGASKDCLLQVEHSDPHFGEQMAVNMMRFEGPKVQIGPNWTQLDPRVSMQPQKGLKGPKHNPCHCLVRVLRP